MMFPSSSTENAKRSRLSSPPSNQVSSSAVKKLKFDPELVDLIFTCNKCLEPRSRDDLFEMTLCGHQFCRDCARSFLLQWLELRCPMSEGSTNSPCPELMSFSEAELLLDGEELNLFRSGRVENEAELLAVAAGGENFGCKLCTLTNSSEIIEVSTDCRHQLCIFCGYQLVNDPQTTKNTVSKELLSCPISGCFAKLSPNVVEKLRNPLLTTFDCPICCDQVSRCDSFRFQRTCGHELCLTCVRAYLKSLIGQRQPLKCPIPDCKSDLDFADAELALDNVDDYDKLFNMLLEIGIADCIHCPKANCEGVAEVVAPRTLFVCPKCKYEMCTKCQRDWHGAATCEQYEKWLEENGRGDTAFKEYMRNKHVQMCPRCRQAVERNTGCNHMSCRCGAHFCYRCGRDLDRHATHKCRQILQWE